MSKITINNPTIELSQADNDFISMVNNRLTVYGQLPYTVPVMLIVDVIKESARFFFKDYQRSYETVYGYISKDDITNYITDNGQSDIGGDPTFREVLSFAVKLPPQVRNVTEIYETNVSGATPTMANIINASAFNGEIAFNYMSSSTSGGNSISGINNSLYIIEKTVRIVQNQAFKTVMSRMVPFNFNTITKMLLIHQKLTNNFVIKYKKDIELQNLYMDDLFCRYVTARCRQELRRLLGGHSIDLPGNVTLNAETISEGCDDEVNDIREKIASQSGIGDVILRRY